MSIFERRLMTRHPLRWAHAFAFQIAVALSLIGLGGIALHPVFARLIGGPLWPWLMIALGLTVLASTAAIHDARAQAAVGAGLFGFAVLRGGTYGLFLLVGADGFWSVEGALATTLLLHWIMVGAMGLRWTTLAVTSGLDVMVAASRDDRVD